MANSNKSIDNLLIASTACANVAISKGLTLEYTYLAKAINDLLRCSKPTHKDLDSVVKYAAYFDMQGIAVINAADCYQYELDRELQGR